MKYKSMRGYYAPYVPGWDCHGLPIENKVEEQLGAEKMAKIDTATFRKICREYATKQLDGQREGFKRLGVGLSGTTPTLPTCPNTRPATSKSSRSSTWMAAYTVAASLSIGAAIAIPRSLKLKSSTATK